MDIRGEIAARSRIGLPVPPELFARHRANECREDADTAFLVGTDNVQRALHDELKALIKDPFNAKEYNEMSARASRGSQPEYYPTSLERQRLMEYLRNNPALMEQFLQDPHSIQFTGSCTIENVQETGPKTTPPARQAAPEQMTFG